MKHMLRYALLFATILIVATSCKKSVPEQTKYIPKDAMFVFDLNWKSLSDKASKGNINWDSLYSSVADEKADSMINEGKKMVHDFMRSGIDTTKDIFFFAKTSGSIMSGQQVSGGVVGAMKDAAAKKKSQTFLSPFRNLGLLVTFGLCITFLILKHQITKK